MRQYILLNTTYYITRYSLSNPLFKLVFFLLISIIIRQTLDISNYAYCMEDNPLDYIQTPKRVTFDPSIPDEDPDSISAYRKEIERQKSKVSLLRGRLRSAESKLLAYTEFKEQYKEYQSHLERYRIMVNKRDFMLYHRDIEIEELALENKRLTRELAVAKSEASRFSKILHSLNIFKR